MKKFTLVLLVIALAVTGVFANGKTEVPTGDLMAYDELMNASWDEIYAQAKVEGKVTFFVWHDEACYTEIKKAFETQYPGVTFELVVSDQSAALDKMIAEAPMESGSFDISVCNAPQKLIEAGAVYGPIVQKLENAKNLDAGLCHAQEGYVHNEFFAPLYRNQGGLVYNSNKVKNPPETWKELEAWIDKNPGKFGVTHPLQGGAGGVFLLAIQNALCGGLDKYEGDLEADPAKMANWSIMWNWLIDRIRDGRIVITSSNNDSLSRLNQGELDLVVAWDDGTYTAQSNGELTKAAKFYVPEFGMPGGGDTIGLLKNAKHPAAALLAANFLTGDTAQKLINDYQHAIPGRTDIKAEYSVVPAEDNANRLNWTAYCYKVAYCKGFVSEVLSKI